METKLSIIIPVFNEAEGILAFAQYLKAHLYDKEHTEILFVDGGSEDATVNVLLSHGFTVHAAQKGRALQMNYGAKMALGSVLYFLHADSFPEQNFDKAILHAIRNGSEVGCFKLQFDSTHPMLGFFSKLAHFNYPICRGGDQSLYITKKLFFKLGGYNERFLVYEDNEFTNRIYKKGLPFTLLKAGIKTSARKYEHIGHWKLQFHFAMMHVLYYFTKDEKKMYSYYKKYITQ